MAVDLSPLEDNDWLVCTDTNGITYKVSFENIKGLLAPRTGMDITIDTEMQVPGNTFFSLLTGGEPSKLSPGGEVDWGDGSPFGNLANSVSAGSTGYILDHEYAAPGVYTIKIRSSFFFTVMGTRSDIGGGTALGTPAKIIKVGPFEPEYIERFGETLYPGSNFDDYPEPYFGILDYSWSGTSVPNDQDAYNIILGIDYTKLNQLAGTWGEWPTTSGPLQNWPKLDYSTIKTLRGTWLRSNILTWHNNEEVTFPVCEDMAAAWADCSGLTNFQKIYIPNVFTLSNTWRSCTGLTSFPELEYPSVRNLTRAWQNCENLVSWGDADTETDFPDVQELNHTWEGCKNLQSFKKIKIPSVYYQMRYTWAECTNLTSFPKLDLPVSCTEMWFTWQNCTGLTSFPDIDFSNITFFGHTWRGCRGLTSFPFIDTSEGQLFWATWMDNQNLISFPALDMSKGQYFSAAWSDCVNLKHFPPNMFDEMSALNFGGNGFGYAWFNCNLTVESMENIFVSIDKNGVENGELGVQNNNGASPTSNAGYSTWTAATVVAFNNLIQKGWDILYNP